jgi:hypothetical protein
MFKGFFLLLIMLTVFSAASDAQFFRRNAPKKAERSLFRKNSVKGIKKEAKVREPRKVTKAKREQEERQAKIKKDYARAVEDKKKRVVEIQSPEVQERMKQNKKNTDLSYRERKKNKASATRKGRRKY